LAAGKTHTKHIFQKMERLTRFTCNN